MDEADRCPCCKADISLRIGAVRHRAWTDLLSAFTQKQRQHIATLLAHKWHIGAVTLRNTNEGRDYTDVVTGEQQPENGGESHGR